MLTVERQKVRAGALWITERSNDVVVPPKNLTFTGDISRPLPLGLVVVDRYDEHLPVAFHIRLCLLVLLGCEVHHRTWPLPVLKKEHHEDDCHTEVLLLLADVTAILHLPDRLAESFQMRGLSMTLLTCCRDRDSSDKASSHSMFFCCFNGLRPPFQRLRASSTLCAW